MAIINGQAQFEADLGNVREARAMADLSLRETPNSARHKALPRLPSLDPGTHSGRKLC